jgi:exosortase J
MPTLSSAEMKVEAVPGVRGSASGFPVAATILAVLGTATIAPSMLVLWTMWTNDALKSVGMVIPAVSLALILRAWKSIGWERQGSWWGLALILTAAAGAWIEGRANLVFVFSPETSRIFPPASLVILLYGAGVVLLIGGTKLLRAALFPVLLLWLVNPVPRAFSLWVDLPLQHAAAGVARSLAIHLGQRLTPDKLQLMFTPEFGMFIAPGCNGVRGSVTMGLIALIAAYLYRFRWRSIVLITAGAVMLGYVFNLLRLCSLILYYLVAMRFSWLQNKAEQADYVIGAVLFLAATMLLFGVIGRLRPSVAAEESGGAGPEYKEEARERIPGHFAGLTVFAAIIAIGLIRLPRTIAEYRFSVPVASATVDPFPQQFGRYVRTREWNETSTDGPIIYRWAEYALEGVGTPIAVGVSPVPDWHNPLICHSIRGEDPVWQGQLTAATTEGTVEFSSAFYNDGASQHLEASTLCAGGACGEYATRRTHMGFVFSSPHLRSLIAGARHSSSRVLLKAEKPDATASSDATRSQLTGDIEEFLAGVSLNKIVWPTGQ